jgi:hypothetical protein
MDSLADYYIHQGGGGGSEYQDESFGSVYVGSPYVQRGHGFGIFHAGVFRALRPLAIRFPKTLGHEALNTLAQILTDIRTKQPQTTVKDIVTDRLAESAQRLVTKLKEGDRRRKRETSIPPRNKKKPHKKRRESIKGNIFS